MIRQIKIEYWHNIYLFNDNTLLVWDDVAGAWLRYDVVHVTNNNNVDIAFVVDSGKDVAMKYAD